MSMTRAELGETIYAIGGKGIGGNVLAFIGATSGQLILSLDGVGFFFLPEASETIPGLMSSADKYKLNNLVSGYLGYYATSAALAAAHETGTDGQFASVGETDTIWAWDTTTAAWKNTDSNTINPSWDNITGKPTFAAVATSGAYADLTGKPGLASSEADGLFSKEDKAKLDSMIPTLYVDDVDDFVFLVEIDSGTGNKVASYTPDGGSKTSLAITEDGKTITFPYAALGIGGIYTYSLYNDSNILLSSSAEVSYQFVGTDLILGFSTGWPVGTYTLSANAGKGLQGPRGESGTPEGDWDELTYAASITLQRTADLGEMQKVTAAGALDLTPPTLSSIYPRLLLQIATGGYGITLSGAPVIAAGTSSTWLIGWYHDGTYTRRLAAVEVTS